jgi:hypothetical protein
MKMLLKIVSYKYPDVITLAKANFSQGEGYFRNEEIDKSWSHCAGHEQYHAGRSFPASNSFSREEMMR